MQSVAFDRYLRLLVEIPENVLVLERIEACDGNSRGERADDISIFTSLRDVEVIKNSAVAFTELLETGRLYQAYSA